MASNLVLYRTHEAENTLEASTREAFNIFEPQLRPPLQLTVRSEQEYPQLSRAILHGLLSEPQYFNVHLKHLHAIVVDGYRFLTNLATKIVLELYPKLVPTARIQLLLLASSMVDVVAEGFDGLLISLMRQMISGDFSESNVWLCAELVNLLTMKWDFLVKEEPSILLSALYAYLRLLAGHCRPCGISDQKVIELKKMEIHFCTRLLQEQFHLCMGIGRDLIRILQELVHVPAFKDIWKKLLLHTGEFRVPCFTDISKIYSRRTPSEYFLLRITPEMEGQLRFLLTHVKLGNQLRYQTWFARKFFFDDPHRDSVVTDIVRFVCRAHHPPNEIIQSDVLPRWALVGWLLKCCRKNHTEATSKLALFYDWLFFDGESIMDVEPAILLIVNSIPRYADMTHSLLDFILLLADNYDVERREIVHRGVLSSFDHVVSRGVIASLDVLTSSETIPSSLRAGLCGFLSRRQKPEVPPPLDRDRGLIRILIRDLGESHTLSTGTATELVRRILQVSAGIGPEVLAEELNRQLEANGRELFTAVDDGVGCLTLLMIRAFVSSPDGGMRELLLHWSTAGRPVGARLLSHAATEAEKELVDRGFSAYRSWCESVGDCVRSVLLRDLVSCCEWKRDNTATLFGAVFRHLSDLAKGDIEIIRVLVERVDHAGLLEIQYGIVAGKLSVVSWDNMSDLIRASMDWSFVEQHKLWGLIRTESTLPGVPVERVLLEFFYSDNGCNSNATTTSAVAVGGLMSLCNSRDPTVELVGAVALVPGGETSARFALAVFSCWESSRGPMLMKCLSGFLEKLRHEDAAALTSSSTGFVTNQATVNWLENYCLIHGWSRSNDDDLKRS